MRKRFNSLLAAVALLFAVALPVIPIATLTTGCAAVQNGQRVEVVRAEQLDASSFDIVNAFLTFETQNADALWKIDHGIKKAADSLRVEFPPAHASLKSLTRIYKVTGNAADLTALQKAMAIVTALQNEAAKWHAAGKI